MLKDTIMKQRFFITATGTDIGKSFITAGLIQQAKSRHVSIAAYKPLISGFDEKNPAISDTGLLLQSLGEPLNKTTLNRLSPWRFRAPLAPSMAARFEGTTIDIEALLTHSRKALSGPEDIILIEGVGGVMVPISANKTVLDWIEALGIPTILVTGSYLGCLSHTLTALRVLQQRQIPIHTLIINESTGSSVALDAVASELKPWVTSNLITVKRRLCCSHELLEELAVFFDSGI